MGTGLRLAQAGQSPVPTQQRRGFSPHTSLSSRPHPRCAGVAGWYRLSASPGKSSIPGAATGRERLSVSAGTLSSPCHYAVPAASVSGTRSSFGDGVPPCALANNCSAACSMALGIPLTTGPLPFAESAILSTAKPRLPSSARPSATRLAAVSSPLTPSSPADGGNAPAPLAVA